MNLKQERNDQPLMDGGCQEDAIENAFFFRFFFDFININFLLPAQCTTLTLITLQLQGYQLQTTLTSFGIFYHLPPWFTLSTL